MSPARLGWVEVSSSVIRDVLKAPASAEILGAEFKYPGVVRLLFESDDLPEVSGLIPILQPVIDGSGWNWNVPPAPKRRLWCSWQGTFPPPTAAEDGLPDFSLESWSSGKASVWQAALKADETITNASVGVNSRGQASASGVFQAESSEDAAAQAREAFTSALSGVSFDGDVRVADLSPAPVDGQRSAALISFDNHVRSHGCGEPEFGGFARCPVASALWSAIPNVERANIVWLGGGPA